MSGRFDGSSWRHGCRRYSVQGRFDELCHSASTLRHFVHRLLGSHSGLLNNSPLGEQNTRSLSRKSFVPQLECALASRDPVRSNLFKAFAIASLSPRELSKLMDSCPAPDVAQMTGKWYGINKGFAAAIAGMPLDIKVLDKDCCVHGYNILVEPLPSINCIAVDGNPKSIRPHANPKRKASLSLSQAAAATIH